MQLGFRPFRWRELRHRDLPHNDLHASQSLTSLRTLTCERKHLHSGEGFVGRQAGRSTYCRRLSVLQQYYAVCIVSNRPGAAGLTFTAA